jgi:glycosyltransferase involved in cell wall biosynthesis
MRFIRSLKETIVKKILILSDSPTCTSGLGRISRDLAIRIAENMSDVVEVATCGYGAPKSRHLPFEQYSVQDPTTTGWQVGELPQVWDDFVGDDEGILFTIWDASRLLWLGDSKYCTIPQLKKFLDAVPMKKIAYWPIDAYGVEGKLSNILAYTVNQFDVSLAYTQFGANVLDATFSGKKHEFIPHGIDSSIFYPHDKEESRKTMESLVFGESLEGAFITGAVCTNQLRKDFGLLFATVKELLISGKNVKLWLNTDSIMRYWDVQALVADFALQGRIAVTMGLTNEELACYYSACDITILPSIGEGLGYPAFESIFCGTPCFTVNYGGTPEFYKNPEHLVKYRTCRYEGVYSNVRPVIHPFDMAEAIKLYGHIRPKPNLDLDWTHLWPKWEAYFRREVQ